MFGLDGADACVDTFQRHERVRESEFQEWETEAKRRLELEDAEGMQPLKVLSDRIEELQCHLRSSLEGIVGRLNDDVQMSSQGG